MRDWLTLGVKLKTEKLPEIEAPSEKLNAYQKNVIPKISESTVVTMFWGILNNNG